MFNAPGNGDTAHRAQTFGRGYTSMAPRRRAFERIRCECEVEIEIDTNGRGGLLITEVVSGDHHYCARTPGTARGHGSKMLLADAL